MALVASACVGGIAACLGLPWLLFPAATDQPDATSSFEELRQGGVAYERNLVLWPVAAYVALLGLTAAAIAARLLRAHGQHLIGPVLGAGMTGAGFLLTLSGTRWLGLYVARLSDTGPAILHLHVAPYLNLAAGLGLAVAGIVVSSRTPNGVLRKTLRRRGVRHCLVVAGAAVGWLLLTPLVPLATAHPAPGLAFHYDELTLAVFEASSNDRDYSAASHLAQARTQAWVLLGLALAAAAAQGAMGEDGGRGRRASPWVAWVLLLPLVFGMGHLVLFYSELPRLGGGARPFPNPFPILGLAVAALALAQHIRTVTVPSLVRGGKA